MDNLFIDVLKNGTYYNPAWKHYEEDHIVNCDRCHKNDINIAIGYIDKDLCLKCVDEINKNIKTLELEESLKYTIGDELSKMTQNTYLQNGAGKKNKSGSYNKMKKAMHQNMYKKKLSTGKKNKSGSYNKMKKAMHQNMYKRKLSTNRKKKLSANKKKNSAGK